MLTRYSKWIGLVSAILLIGVCFMPWTFHADIQKSFTGFFSEKDMYGKPGKFIIFLGMLSAVFFLLKKLWAKRANLFVAGLLLAYAFKTYILYTSCYNAYCPQKLPGIYLLMGLPVVILLAALFPQMPLPTMQDERDEK